MPAADASCNSKAAPSRLKGYNAKTPTKLQQKSSSSKPEPQTPGNKQQKSSGSSAEDALLNLSPQMLAPNLMLLNQLLGVCPGCITRMLFFVPSTLHWAFCCSCSCSPDVCGQPEIGRGCLI